MTNSRLIGVFTVAALISVTAMCGGKAVIDPGSGQGGNAGVGGGGASGPGPGVGGSAVVVGPGPTTTTGPSPGACFDSQGETRPSSGDCISTCEIFFCCSARECDGLEPDDEADFLGFCIEACEDQMALTAVVNGEQCEQTIATVSGASMEFAFLCENGFP